MTIVVCEDEQTFREAIEQSIRRWQAQAAHADVQLRHFASSEDFLEHWALLPEIDLLFVDIQFPGEMNGIALARRIRETNQDVTIVFCTNYDDYVYEGYTVNALRYLKKPVSDADIFFCCSYVYNRLASRRDRALMLYSAGKRFVLHHAEIRAIEADNHNLRVYSTTMEEPLRIYARLEDILNSLPKELFVLCHRSYIVNVAHIRALTRTKCRLSNGDILPISRTCMNNVNRVFDRYHQGGEISDGLDRI